MLQDQDPFAPLPPPDETTLQQLITDDTINLREAMRMLNYGPVADYFAYRWATPTFLSGLALLQHVVHPSRLPVVEVACGMGHFLRTLEANGVATVGVDLVFSKLWLARRYLGVQGTLICGDIEQSPPLATEQAASVFCHDAFYFFEPQEKVLSHLRTLASGGPLAVGHVHTNAVDHNVAGYPRSAEAYRRLTADGTSFFDDTRFVEAWLNPSKPAQQAVPELRSTEAIAWIEGDENQELYPLDQPAASLSLNPLLNRENTQIAWPTERFRKEYEADAAYLRLSEEERGVLQEWMILSEDKKQARQPNSEGFEPIVTQPELDLFRRRILLDLPEQW